MNLFDADEGPTVSEAVDLVVFRAADDTKPIRELCWTFQSRIG
jgi:hypothetical protein